ncbi:uncharacterized protein MONOS_16077 [Monocercomonoides exilis]|uniref:uncharacterized protein n=1 Tax=Monocercomonoides exilis TaxID=2049356 RepID=UPI003559889F|nr:hypothetical protein MONOS_16077 [Monocercomonoides exilis]|eukprot:MONOS_16077.1-p1 / transcript=MONOS_16077.1 / gene=MONOS_16077 / organism=Monocercomonoides_exilis_PA203 / gene_product=unspecified product / transcript_product=unspecified product / location=Mono_scaffold01494:6138-6629(+) / protein_length=164 / sequence_SO=supercontig / SO=protein_coding / is_pseudo=false
MKEVQEMEAKKEIEIKEQRPPFQLPSSTKASRTTTISRKGSSMPVRHMEFVCILVHYSLSKAPPPSLRRQRAAHSQLPHVPKNRMKYFAHAGHSGAAAFLFPSTSLPICSASSMLMQCNLANLFFWLLGYSSQKGSCAFFLTSASSTHTPPTCPTTPLSFSSR